MTSDDKDAPSIPIISIAEYRRILNDHESTDERIIERLDYLEALCRNVIRGELEQHAKSQLRSERR